jgi:hypothetical protein
MYRFWKVNSIQSLLLGQTLQGVEVRNLVHPLNSERHWQIWAEIVFISICHQANWYDLHKRIIEIAIDNPEILRPSSLLSLTPKDFKFIFGPGLDEQRMRAGERVRILRELAQCLPNWPTEGEQGWLKNGSINIEGDCGIMPWLNKFRVFSGDPLQKKSRVLIHQLLRYGLINVKDPENVRPAVDYHIMRLYVRTGRVIPVTEEAFERVRQEEVARVEFLTHLRRAVEEAMWHSAVGAGLRMDHLNHIEWQIARSICVRSGARCRIGPIPEKPIDEALVSLAASRGGCPLATYCQGYHDPELRSIVDPRSVRPYY